jgi:hypothetical protein
LRHGGCGIRANARHAAIARVACLTLAQEVARSVCRVPPAEAAPEPLADVGGVVVIPATPPPPLELPGPVLERRACPYVAELPSVQALFLRFATAGKLDRTALPEDPRKATAHRPHPRARRGDEPRCSVRSAAECRAWAACAVGRFRSLARGHCRYALRPLVVDTLGARDPRALGVFRRIARPRGAAAPPIRPGTGGCGHAPGVS